LSGCNEILWQHALLLISEKDLLSFARKENFIFNPTRSEKHHKKYFDAFFHFCNVKNIFSRERENFFIAREIFAILSHPRKALL
jgi:hypothetical protein